MKIVFSQMILDDCSLYGKLISSVFSKLVGSHSLRCLFQSLGSRPKECHLYTLMLILKSLRLNPCFNGMSSDSKVEELVAIGMSS